MPDISALVYKALKADSTLISLLGGEVPKKEYKRIYNSPVAPHKDEYPRITLFEVINEDVEPADDEPQFTDANIRIDVWTEEVKNISPICNQIKSVLKNKFNMCNVRFESTMNDADVNRTIYHKPINLYLLLEQGE